MLMPTRLTVVRHGETDWNAEGRLMNQLDSPLSRLGRRQAELLATRLAQCHFDAFYSSDLGRTLATSRPISEVLGYSPTAVPSLRERSLGIFQGLTWTEVFTQFPDEHRSYETDLDYTVPSGESAHAFAERVIDAFETIAQNHLGQDVLVVTHGGVLDVLFRYVVKMPYLGREIARLPNAAINIFEVGPEGWVISTWGDVNHLKSLAGASVESN
jgi:probable phosphoglycerate mutase